MVGRRAITAIADEAILIMGDNTLMKITAGAAFDRYVQVGLLFQPHADTADGNA